METHHMKWFSALALFALLLLVSISIQAQEITMKDPVMVNCGDIIEGEFTQNFQPHPYIISMQPGDSLQITAEPLGDTLSVAMILFAPNDGILGYGGGTIYENIKIVYPGKRPNIQTGILSARGNYTLVTYNAAFDGTSSRPYQTREIGGVGVYTLYVGCTLRNGTVIAPGDSPQNEVVSQDEPTDTEAKAPAAPAFSGFGFPGLAPVDFSAGIEIPLSKSQLQTIPLGGDVALYTYQATGGETATLSASRLSGDISIGITVINKATNEIIFLAGLPSSNNLSTQLTFPADGTYAIGLFRLDTAERRGTSGAVQLMLE